MVVVAGRQLEVELGQHRRCSMGEVEQGGTWLVVAVGKEVGTKWKREECELEELQPRRGERWEEGS